MPHVPPETDIDYLFSDIKIIDVTVTNTFTRVPVTIKNLRFLIRKNTKNTRIRTTPMTATNTRTNIKI